MKEEDTATAAKKTHHHSINRFIAILGAGNMGTALLKGILDARLTPSNKITACGVRVDKLQLLSRQWDTDSTLSLNEAVEGAEIVLLCVKPQTLPRCLRRHAMRSERINC